MKHAFFSVAVRHGAASTQHGTESPPHHQPNLTGTSSELPQPPPMSVVHGVAMLVLPRSPHQGRREAKPSVPPRPAHAAASASPSHRTNTARGGTDASTGRSCSPPPAHHTCTTRPLPCQGHTAPAFTGQGSASPWCYADGGPRRDPARAQTATSPAAADWPGRRSPLQRQEAQRWLHSCYWAVTPAIAAQAKAQLDGLLTG